MNFSKRLIFLLAAISLLASACSGNKGPRASTLTKQQNTNKTANIPQSEQQNVDNDTVLKQQETVSESAVGTEEASLDDQTEATKEAVDAIYEVYALTDFTAENVTEYSNVIIPKTKALIEKLATQGNESSALKELLQRAELFVAAANSLMAASSQNPEEIKSFVDMLGQELVYSEYAAEKAVNTTVPSIEEKEAKEAWIKDYKDLLTKELQMASAQIVDSAANSTQDKSIRKEVLERINSKIIASDKLLSAFAKEADSNSEKANAIYQQYVLSWYDLVNSPRMELLLLSDEAENLRIISKSGATESMDLDGSSRHQTINAADLLKAEKSAVAASQEAIDEILVTSNGDLEKVILDFPSVIANLLTLYPEKAGLTLKMVHNSIQKDIASRVWSNAVNEVIDYATLGTMFVGGGSLVYIVRQGVISTGKTIAKVNASRVLVKGSSRSARILFARNAAKGSFRTLTALGLGKASLAGYNIIENREKRHRLEFVLAADLNPEAFIQITRLVKESNDYTKDLAFGTVEVALGGGSLSSVNKIFKEASSLEYIRILDANKSSKFAQMVSSIRAKMGSFVDRNVKEKLEAIKQVTKDLSNLKNSWLN